MAAGLRFANPAYDCPRLGIFVEISVRTLVRGEASGAFGDWDGRGGKFSAPTGLGISVEKAIRGGRIR
jgi:hypothetical protein